MDKKTYKNLSSLLSATSDRVYSGKAGIKSADSTYDYVLKALDALQDTIDEEYKISNPVVGISVKHPDKTFIPTFDYGDETWSSIYYRGDLLKVSSYGRIMKAKTGKILKQSLGKPSGRFRVAAGYPRKTTSVHRIVALTYLGERPEGYEIDHINGNRLDNRPTNLEYVTPKENKDRAVKNGLIGSALKLGS